MNWSLVTPSGEVLATVEALTHKNARNKFWNWWATNFYPTGESSKPTPCGFYQCEIKEVKNG